MIVVASHCPTEGAAYLPNYGYDSLPADLQQLIVDEIAVDSETADNIDKLRELISEQATRVGGMGDLFPVHWDRAREAVLKEKSYRGRPYIRYDRFLEICREQDPPLDDTAAATLATAFMHSLGHAIYYGHGHKPNPGGDEKNAAAVSEYETRPGRRSLSEIIVLDAQWLSRAFVQVLEDEPTVEKGGLLDHSRLDYVWHGHHHEGWEHYDRLNEHPFLIDLMHAFDISYVVPGEEGHKSLVAQLVPGIRPDLPWSSPPDRPGQHSLTIECQMNDEAPGLMAWFTVHRKSVV